MPIRASRLLAVAVLPLLAALAPATTAVAGPTRATPPPAWTTATFPVPSAPNGTLQAVGCTPDGAYCVEVGSFHDPTGRQQPLAAHRTGTTWQRDPVPAVTPLGVSLDAVSCASATSCAAVGATGSGLGDLDDRALAYSWNGTRWTRGALTLPGGGTASRLTGVACGAPGSCVAVGETSTSDGGRRSLSYSFDGSTWTARTVPVAHDAGGEGLKAVSCPAANSCTAVGASGNPAGIVFTWNGTTWRAGTPAPAPAGTWIGELSGVSCASATACTAVGYTYDGGATDSAVIEHLAAGRWVRDDVPAEIVFATAVSCPSSGECRVLAARQVGEKSDPGVASRDASGSWTFTTVPVPAGAYASLTGIACSAADACTLVGNGDLPFVDRLVGTTWSPEPTVAPRGVFGSALHGVSCTSATACTAVGRYGTASATLPLVERWDGSAWTRQTIPDRLRQPFTELGDVACTTATDCVAVGKVADDPTGISVSRPLLTRWTAGGWSTVATPAPTDTEGALTAVSCASTTSCMAVGYAYDGGSGALAYVLRGTTWTTTRVPLPSGLAGLTLTGVSCVTATRCVAVGSGPSQTGEEHVDLLWNGTAWSVGPAVGAVDAVSCVGTGSRCTAVGTADRDEEQVHVFTLAGGTWTQQSTPDPGSKDPSHLAGVSCVGSTCTAVGASASALVLRSVAGGAWQLESAVTPPGAGGLEDVSCADTARCVAVGTFGPTAAIEQRVTGVNPG